MSVHVHYDLDLDSSERFFEYAGFRARNTREPLTRAGGKLLHHVNMTFATEGDWIGDPWPALKPSYERVKEATYPGRQINVATGDLRRRATSRAAISIIDETLHYTVSGVKAAAVQSGWENSRGRGEPRPFVVVTEGLVQEIESEFADWLDDIKRANRSRSALSLVNPMR